MLINRVNSKLNLKDAIDSINSVGRVITRMTMAVVCYSPEDMLEKQRKAFYGASAEGAFK